MSAQILHRSHSIAGMAYLQVLTVFLRLDLVDPPYGEVERIIGHVGGDMGRVFESWFGQPVTVHRAN